MASQVKIRRAQDEDRKFNRKSDIASLLQLEDDQDEEITAGSKLTFYSLFFLSEFIMALILSHSHSLLPYTNEVL